MNWFVNAKYDKSKRQIKPVTQPSKPKPPSKSKIKKPKKVFEGPKDPYGYRRKLYIPKKFIMAGLDVRATYEQDVSEYALRHLQRQVGGHDIGLYVRWIPEVGSTCPECMGLSHERWGSINEFLSTRKFSASGAGIYGHSHPGCRCYLRVTAGDNDGFYVIGVNDPVPNFESGMTIDQIIKSKVGEEEIPFTDIEFEEGPAV